jgi:transcriptional regulator with XRE-family HTH domain
MKSKTKRIFNKIHEGIRNPDLRLEKSMVQFRFMSEVEKQMELKGINQKQLSEKIGTSSSYVTQIFTAGKPLNMETIAKIQKALDITFEIKAVKCIGKTISNDIMTDFVKGRVIDYSKYDELRKSLQEQKQEIKQLKYA